MPSGSGVGAVFLAVMMIAFISVHSSLMEVLLRFRTYNVTLITDTFKMYILIQLALWTNIFTEVDIQEAERLLDNTI